MNIYTFLSLEYDLLDIIWFGEKGVNPRNVIRDIIPNENLKILDMCCGTLSNGLSIAKAKNNCKIYDVDRSKDMLREAKRKIRKCNLKNVKVKNADATASGLKDKSSDYIVIGLVLHECSPELKADILEEAYRLLKDGGKLIVLEWEEQKRFLQRIKYAPLYALEVLITKSFKEFYKCDKKEYFLQHGFEMSNVTHCNYSSVMEFVKSYS